MIIPNKITPYKRSILSRLPLLLEALLDQDKSPARLWEELQNQFEDINEFILTIDVAFVLQTVDYLKDKQVIRYVKADKV
jgi:hypothetical protein